MRSPAGSRLVFVSYSHVDAEWRRRFEVMLNPLVREGRLELWADPYIPVGDDWRRTIDDAISRTHTALLLVSADFLASPFIMEEELPALEDQGVRRVCVLVRECLWEQVPTLARLEWAHDPKVDGPVSRAADPDAQITRVCRRFVGTISYEGDDSAANGRGSFALGQARQAHERVVAVEAGGPPGRADGVPPLPIDFVTRGEQEEIRDTLLGVEHAALGITGNARALGLHGQGGIGKTVLASAVAEDPKIAERFTDGIYWVTVGERANLVAAQTDLLRRLGHAHEIRSVTQGLETLRAVLANRRCLLIVDDVWSSAAAGAFRVTGPRGRVLYTTRDRSVLQAVGAEVKEVDVLSDAAARELLGSLTHVPSGELPRPADYILEATGRVALAIALVGAAIGRGGRTWAQAAEQLRWGAETFLDHPYANTFKAMQVGIAGLEPDLAKAYQTLAIYPEDTDIPVVSIERFWGQVFGHSPAQVRDEVASLVTRGLLAGAGETVAFHDLQREFLLLKATDLEVLHADLLNAYRTLLPGPEADWSQLPTDEPYVWDHLIYHLRGSGDHAAMAHEANDLAFLAMRIFFAGAYAAESDLRQVAAFVGEDEGVRWAMRQLAQWRHLLAKQPTLESLAAALLGRAHSAPREIDAAGLKRLLARRFLQIRWGVPTAAAALDRVLEGHLAPIRHLEFAAEAPMLLACDDDGVRVWGLNEARAVGAMEVPKLSSAPALSPDANLIAVGDRQGTLQLIERAQGDVVAAFGGHGGGVTAVCFSPDGALVATGDAEGTVRLFEVVTMGHQADLTRHTAAVTALAFAPGGDVLASAGADARILLWEPGSVTPRAVLEGHRRSVATLAWSPSGDLLASGSEDWDTRLWSRDGVLVGMVEGFTGSIVKIAFAPDGESIGVLIADDANVLLYGVPDLHQRQLLRGHTDSVRTFAFASGRALVATAGDDEKICLWDSQSGRLSTTLYGHAGSVEALAFSSDGGLLASGGDDRVIRLWQPMHAVPEAAARRRAEPVTALAFAPNGAVLASAGQDNSVRLWDPAEGRLVDTLEGDARPVSAMGFSPDCSRLVVARGKRRPRIAVWNPVQGHLLDSFEETSGPVKSVSFSPDGSLLAVVYSRSAEAAVWLASPVDRISDKVHLKGLHGIISALTFSPDGELVCGASLDHTIVLWDVVRIRQALVRAETDRTRYWGWYDERHRRVFLRASGRVDAQTFLRGHDSPVRAIACSPDARLLASVDDDAALRVWDLSRNRPVAAFRGHGPSSALAFSPDGATLAGPGPNLTVQLWDVASADVAHLLGTHQPALTALAFSIDGALIATADRDVVYIWDVQSGERVSQLGLGVGITALVWRQSGIAVAANFDVMLLSLTARDRLELARQRPAPSNDRAHGRRGAETSG